MEREKLDQSTGNKNKSSNTLFGDINENVRTKMSNIISTHIEETDDRRYGLFNENGTMITFFKIYEGESKSSVFIDYYTRPEYQNQGFATLGLKLLSEKLFFEQNILEIKLNIPSSDYSRKVAKNCSFTPMTKREITFFLLHPCVEAILEEEIRNNFSGEKSNQYDLEHNLGYYKKLREVEKKYKKFSI